MAKLSLIDGNLSRLFLGTITKPSLTKFILCTLDLIFSPHSEHQFFALKSSSKLFVTPYRLLGLFTFLFIGEYLLLSSLKLACDGSCAVCLVYFFEFCSWLCSFEYFFNFKNASLCNNKKIYLKFFKLTSSIKMFSTWSIEYLPSLSWQASIAWFIVNSSTLVISCIVLITSERFFLIFEIQVKTSYLRIE